MVRRRRESFSADADMPAVPRFPVLAASVGPGDRVEFDGAVIEPAEGESPYEALLRAAAAAAAERSGVHAVRVRAVVRTEGEEGESQQDEVFPLVVDAGGRVWEHAPGEAREVRETDSHRILLGGLGALILLGVFGGAGFAAVNALGGDEPQQVATASTTSSTRPPKPASPTRVALPVLDPRGRHATALWASEPVGSAVAGDRQAAVLGGLAVAPDADGSRVVAVSPVNGKTAWSFKHGERVSELRTLGSGKSARLAVISTGRVAVLDVRGKQVASRKLEAGQEVVVTPSSVVVKAGEGQVLIPQGSKWVGRVLPVGSTPVAVNGSAVMAVDERGQWWRVSDGRVAPAGKSLAKPKKVKDPTGVVAMTPSTLVFGFSGEKPNTVVLQQYSLTDPGKPVGRSVTVAARGGGAGEALVSPDGSWLATAGAVVDLQSGRVVAENVSWTPAAILNDRLFGTSGSRVIELSRAGGEAVAEAPNQVPVGVPFGAAGDVVFIRAEQDDTTRIYGVRLGEPPRGKAAASSSAPPAPNATPSTSSSGPSPTSDGPRSSGPASSSEAAGSSVTAEGGER